MPSPAVPSPSCSARVLSGGEDGAGGAPRAPSPPCGRASLPSLGVQTAPHAGQRGCPPLSGEAPPGRAAWWLLCGLAVWTRSLFVPRTSLPGTRACFAFCPPLLCARNGVTLSGPARWSDGEVWEPPPRSLTLPGELGVASPGGGRPLLPGATGLHLQGSWGAGSGGGDHRGGLCVWHSVVPPKEPPPPECLWSPWPRTVAAGVLLQPGGHWPGGLASWTCLGGLGSEHVPRLTILRRDLSSRCPTPRSPLCACRAVMGVSRSLAQARL